MTDESGAPAPKKCPSCQAEIPDEPMTRESMKPFLDFIESAELVAEAMGEKTSRIVRVQMELAIRMKERESGAEDQLLAILSVGGRPN